MNFKLKNKRKSSPITISLSLLFDWAYLYLSISSAFPTSLYLFNFFLATAYQNYHRYSPKRHTCRSRWKGSCQNCHVVKLPGRRTEDCHKLARGLWECRNFLVVFLANWSSDLHDSNRAHLSLYIKIDHWKFPKKFIVWRAIRNFKPWSRLVGDYLRGNEPKFFTMTYNLPRFVDVSKITLRLVSTPWIQRRSQNCQMSYSWKIYL